MRASAAPLTEYCICVQIERVLQSERAAAECVRVPGAVAVFCAAATGQETLKPLKDGATVRRLIGTALASCG